MLTSDKTAQETPFKSLREYNEYRKATFDIELADGEKKVWVNPGFDFRGTDDAQYGQSTPTLVFCERRGNVALDWELFTGWNMDGGATMMDGRNIGYIGKAMGFHIHLKKDVQNPEYAHIEAKCPLLGGGKCYYESGSYTFGETLQNVLLARGSAGIWAEFDKIFKETYGL